MPLLGLIGLNNVNTQYIQKSLVHWYLQNHRKLPWRDTDNPYFIWISEVMLQQTQVKTAQPFYTNFLQIFPDIHTLAQSRTQDVLKAWEGLGYYARARNLHRAAQIVVEQFGGRIPENWKDIRQLPGVGDYIAAAVLSIAFQKPHAVVDGNVKRVLSRLLAMETPINKSGSHNVFKDAANAFLDRHQPGIFNQALMELGAIVCKPTNPACHRCPLNTVCQAYLEERVADFPIRERRKPIPEYHIAVGVVVKNDKILITRRKSQGLLGGLWEFSGGKVQEHENAQSACVREIKEEVNLSVKVDSYLTRVKHAYSHFKIKMDVYCCRYISGYVKLNGPVDYRWISLQDIQAYPFPKANHKFIPLLGNCLSNSSGPGAESNTLS
jgi:A/G-specific adenine glycosylase